MTGLAHWIDADRAARLGFGVAVGALGLALVSQFVFGLAPCELCLWQRWPYGAAIVFGGAGLWAGGRAAQALFALAGLSFVVGMGLGVFHSGVEFGWWDGLASCSGGGPKPGESFAQFMTRMRDNPPPSCGDRTVFIAVLSMANWNVLVSSLAAALFARAAMPAAIARRRQL